MLSGTNINKSTLLDFLDESYFTTPFPDFVASFTAIKQIISSSTSGACNGNIIFLTASMNGTALTSEITSFSSDLLSSNYRIHNIALGGCDINK